MIPRRRIAMTAARSFGALSLLLTWLLYACGGATGLEDGWDRANAKATTPGTSNSGSPKGGAVPVPGSVPPSGSTDPVLPVTPTPAPTTTSPTVDPPTPRKCTLAIPPNKRFAALDDSDFATLCEFLACSRGGYGSREIACPNGTRTITMPNTLAECIADERTAAQSAGSACQLTMGMLDACYGPWGDNLCVQPGACKAIDAIAITCN